jgi:hypothetical protein
MFCGFSFLAMDWPSLDSNWKQPLVLPSDINSHVLEQSKLISDNLGENITLGEDFF